MRLAFAFVLFLAVSLAAQEPLPTGSLVRLAPLERYDVRRQGYVLSSAGDSAVVRLVPVPEWELRGEVMTLPVHRLQVRTGVKRHKARGALIGGVIGMFGGFVAGKNVGGQLCEGNSYYGTQQCRADTSAEAPLTILGAITGVGVGAFAGWLAKSETWVRAPLAR
jgi:hypothetical protein